MAKTDFKSVDEYIATQPEASQPILSSVRAIVRKALPGAEEVIAYQIPAYKLNGRTVIYFAGWKQHYSLYPVGAELLAGLVDNGTSYTVSKGTIRFKLTDPVPTQLIKCIVSARMQEAAKAG